MISFVIRISCGAMLVLLAGSAVAYESLPDGFRGLQWGTNIATVKQRMVLIEDGGDTKYYSKMEEKLIIGETKVSKVIYGFYKGQLYSGFINFAGYSNYSTLKLILFEKYGAGYQSNQFTENYHWGLLAPITINLKYSKVSDEGFIHYLQNTISHQREEDRKIKAKNASKDI